MSCFIIDDKVGKALQNFDREYPGVPVQVRFEQDLDLSDPVAYCQTLKGQGGSGVLITVNPRYSFVEAVAGLVEALGLASYWTKEKGLPEVRPSTEELQLRCLVIARARRPPAPVANDNPFRRMVAVH